MASAQLFDSAQLLKKLFDGGCIDKGYYDRKMGEILTSSMAAKQSSTIKADVDALKAFRFTKKPALAALLPKMKGEIAKCNMLVPTIKPRSERLDKDGNDTFDLLAWWRANAAELASWVSVLRAVLAHAPNSCPPERVFSILNDSFDDDQKRAQAGYMEFCPVQ